ncbi:MAG TPA: hypothetical protein VGD33_11080, partial [Chitinophagaceae bacterium]
PCIILYINGRRFFFIIYTSTQTYYGRQGSLTRFGANWNEMDQIDLNWIKWAQNGSKRKKQDHLGLNRIKMEQNST